MDVIKYNPITSPDKIIDFVQEYSFPFPGFAAFSLLGFPDSDTDTLKEFPYLGTPHANPS